MNEIESIVRNNRIKGYIIDIVLFAIAAYVGWNYILPLFR